MTTTDSAAVVASLIPLVLLWLAISVALYVWVAVALAAVFRKSGEEGWKGWVPILNIIVLLRIAGLSGWLVLTILFAPALWVVVVFACHRINVSFGLGAGMTVLAALLFPVWATVLGFGSARWVGRDSSGPRRTPDALPNPDARASRSVPPHPVIEPPLGYAPITPTIAAPPAYARGSVPPAPPAPTTAWAGAARPAPAITPPPGGWAPPPLPGPAGSAPSLPGEERRADAVAPAPASARAAAPAPAEDPTHRTARRQPYEFDGFDATGEVTGAISGAPAPIAAVPGVFPPVPDVEESAEPGPRRAASEFLVAPAPAPAPTAAPAPTTPTGGVTVPPVTRVPAAERAAAPQDPWVPAQSPLSDREAFPETSGPVSAIAGAPNAGTPRSARTSVSASHTKPEIPEEEGIDETIIARRRRTDWVLLPPSGDPIPLVAEVVLLGRRPSPDPAFPGAQLISIEDGTVSKTHARLELRDGRWYVTDLGSTNGVLFATLMGTDIETTPGVEAEAGDRFLMGDAEVRLRRTDA